MPPVQTNARSVTTAALAKQINAKHASQKKQLKLSQKKEQEAAAAALGKPTGASGTLGESATTASGPKASFLRFLSGFTSTSAASSTPSPGSDEGAAAKSPGNTAPPPNGGPSASILGKFL